MKMTCVSALAAPQLTSLRNGLIPSRPDHKFLRLQHLTSLNRCSPLCDAPLNQQRQRPQRSLPIRAYNPLIDVAVDAAASSAAADGVFQPQMDPSIAVAAAFAAVPPIIFWARVFLAEQRRQREAEEKELARAELKKKLFGGKR